MLAAAASRRRFKRRAGTALLAVFALLLQTVLLLVHRPPVPPELARIVEAQQTAHQHDHSHHLHTDHGGEQPGPEKAPSKHAGPHCPLCFRLQLAATFLPPTDWIASPPALTQVVADLSDEPTSTAGAEPWKGARPRAPPIA